VKNAILKIYRNTLFRLSLLGAFLFVTILFAALGYVYFATISNELRETDKVLEAEFAEFQKIFEENGLSGIDKEVFLRSASYEGLYILIVGGRDRAVGNLAYQEIQTGAPINELIPTDGNRPTKIPFTYSNPESSDDTFKDRRARGLAGPLKQGDQNVGLLMVGRDVEATMRTGEKIQNSILTSSLIALVLGLISSFFVSQRFTRRIEGFNQLATDVRAGHLDRRAPRNYSEDELDLLAEHLNDMLDHIDRLMTAMRYAGDSIAHDLRSPLTRLRTRLESAAVDLGDGQESEILFAAADDAGELLKTFDAVLRIARLETGERRELLKPLNPKPLLDDLVELYEPACEDAQLEFEHHVEDGITILADRGLLSQAVSNLLENAIKYTPKGGKIALRLFRNKSGRTEISVMDDGPGIPGSDRERVKERFVRLDKSRTEPGSGLGLALVDAIADLHRAEFMMGDGFQSNSERPGLNSALIFPRRRKEKS